MPYQRLATSAQSLKSAAERTPSRYVMALKFRAEASKMTRAGIRSCGCTTICHDVERVLSVIARPGTAANQKKLQDEVFWGLRRLEELRYPELLNPIKSPALTLIGT